MSFTTPPSFQNPDAAAPAGNHAREWGLASVLLGVVLPFCVPLCALVATGGFSAFAVLGGRLGRADERGLLDVLTVLPVVLLTVPGFGLWFGIRGMQWAEKL